MENREVPGRIAEPIDAERQRLCQLGVKPRSVQGPPLAAPRRSLA